LAFRASPFVTDEVVARGAMAAEMAASVKAEVLYGVKAVAIELLTAVVVGKVATVVWGLVRSLWFALRASPFVTEEVVARVAVAAEMAVPRAEVGSYDERAVVMRLLTPVVVGRADTVVERLVRSLWLAFRASPFVTDEVVARGAIAAEMAASVTAEVLYGPKAVAIELLTAVVVGKVATVVWRFVRSLWFALSASPFVTDDVVARQALPWPRKLQCPGRRWVRTTTGRW